MRLKNIHKLIGSAVGVMSVLFVLVLLSPAAAFAEDEGGALDSLKPQHGIPLVIVNIDEDAEHIAAANDNDEDHVYGTMADMNSSENHSVRCLGSVRIEVPDGYELPDGDLTWLGTDLKLDYIRGRGNSTWDKDNTKNPYKIKLSEQTDLFGMGGSKEWALMANVYDSTLMHNRVTYWLGAQLGMPFSVESVPVDVVMTRTGAEDHIYLGCYDLSELVSVEASRVAIDKLKKKPAEISEAGEEEYQKTGGYLFCIFNSCQKDDPESNTFTTTNLVDFAFNDPEFLVEDSLTEWQKGQRQYLKEYVQDIEDLIVNNEEIDEETHNKIAEMLDLRSVADYWLIQEFTKNGDAYVTGSTYFFKPRGDKMYFGPLWDFDLALGLFDESDGEPFPGVEGFNYTSMLWIDELRAKDPRFVEIIEQEWAKLDTALTELTKSGGTLEKYRDEIRYAYAADPQIAKEEENDPDVTADNLRKWIDARHEWMGSNLDKLGNVYTTVTYVADGKPVHVQNKAKIGGAPSDDPEAPAKEGYYFIGWFSDDETPMDEVKLEGPTELYAKYVDEAHATLPTDLFLQESELWREDDEDINLYYDYIVFPRDAVSDKVTWKSSDEGIATVDTESCVHTLRAGDVTITGTTVNGIKAEILLHVVEQGTLELVDPEKVVADSPDIRLKVGEYTQAKWHIVPEGVPINRDSYSFTMSDDNVVAVDGLGVITALSPGTSDVTLTVSYDEDKEVSTTFKVTVVDPNAPADADIGPGTKHKSGGSTYKIITKSAGSKAGTAALITAVNKKSVKVPATVTIKGRKFNVIRIDAGAFKGKKIRTVTIGQNVKTIKKNAFRGSKATKLMVKSKKLTKKSVKGSLRGSKVKRVQVKIGKKSVNKKFVKKYKKIFTRKNAGKKVKVS